MAHSLGSVLSYDILCNQPDLFAALPKRPASAAAGTPLNQQEPNKRPRHISPRAQAWHCHAACCVLGLHPPPVSASSVTLWP